MNNITSLVSQQVFIMLILIIVGFVLTKNKLITKNGSKEISNILLTIVTPSLLIKAYQIDFDISVVKELSVAFFLALITHILFISVCKIMFAPVKDVFNRKVLKFTNIYSNCGFMGIPLLSATLGDKGVLLGSAYLAVFNVLIWTHGLYMFGGDFKLLSVKNLVKNPGVAGTSIALVLFFAQIRLTGVVKDAVGYIAELNTPLAMLLLGTYLARSNLKQAILNKNIYLVCFVRLVFLPVLTILLFKLLGVGYNMAITLVLPAACPCAAMAAIFAEKFDLDPGYPSQIVSLTTIVSLVTLPLMAYLTSVIL